MSSSGPRGRRDRSSEAPPPEGDRATRLVVPRRRLPGTGRGEAILAAVTLVAVIGAAVAAARIDAPAPSAALQTAAHATGPAADVAASPSRAPRQTPSVTPASPCLAIADARPPSVELRVIGRAGVPGRRTYDRWAGATAPRESEAPVPVVGVPIGSPIDLEVVGDGCARAWDIALTTGDAMGVRSIVERQTNPTMDSRVAVQNRFRLRLPGDGGSWDIAATLTFPGGTVDYRWRADLAGPPS